MFLISLHYIKSLDEVEKYLPAHVEFLEKYYAAEIFECSGRKNPRTGGVILARAANRNEIERLIREDPFHANGIAEYEITEFIPTKYSKRFKPMME
jgi:uncharacterized protein YciI